MTLSGWEQVRYQHTKKPFIKVLSDAELWTVTAHEWHGAEPCLDVWSCLAALQSVTLCNIALG